MSAVPGAKMGAVLGGASRALGASTSNAPLHRWRCHVAESETTAPESHSRSSAVLSVAPRAVLSAPSAPPVALGTALGARCNRHARLCAVVASSGERPVELTISSTSCSARERMRALSRPSL